MIATRITPKSRMAQQDEGNNDEDGADEDDEEGWVDELDELSVEERDELKRFN
jgi:chromatin segregation and condensation protein Rec8/ScpA/Scc1 (kleisin family)